MKTTRHAVLTLVSLYLASGNAVAEIAVSANDAKVYLDNGKTVVHKSPGRDTASVIDLSSKPPKIIAEIEVPTSVSGPPLSVALTPDESLALIASATKIDAADPSKIAPNDALSVIDLKAKPPKVIQTLEAGKGPSGISINRAGTLALVANRSDGTVSVFSISGKTVTAAGKVAVGDEKSGPSHVAITPDGKQALVTRDNDNGLVLLKIDGDKVVPADRVFYAGLRPYAVDVTPDGATMVVANIGRGAGDQDTLSVIDMRANPPRTVNTVTVGFAPEGMKLSADGRWCAVVLHNGTNTPSNSPFHSKTGKLVVLRLDGTQLSKVAEAPIGRWSQGVAFSADGKTILVQNMVERDIQVFNFDGAALTEAHRIPLKGGGAAIRTAERR